MQAVDVAETSSHAPLDLLRPMRCGYEPVPGHSCTGRATDIDWNAPGMHRFKCPKCKTVNVVRIVEARAQ